MALVLRGAREEGKGREGKGREGPRCFHELDGCICGYMDMLHDHEYGYGREIQRRRKAKGMISPLSSSSSSFSHTALSEHEFAEDVSSTALQRSKTPTTHTIHTMSRVESRYMLCTGTARTENRQARTHYSVPVESINLST
jgi:hypothetical protein